MARTKTKPTCMVCGHGCGFWIRDDMVYCRDPRYAAGSVPGQGEGGMWGHGHHPTACRCGVHHESVAATRRRVVLPRTWDAPVDCNDVLGVWVWRSLVASPDIMVACGEVVTRAVDKMGVVANKTSVGLAVKRVWPGVVVRQRTVSGRVRWAYVGLAWRR